MFIGRWLARLLWEMSPRFWLISSHKQGHFLIPRIGYSIVAFRCYWRRWMARVPQRYGKLMINWRGL